MEIVASFDIGTTHTGYAYSSKTEYQAQPLNIHLNEEWMSGHANLHTYKMPSIALLKQDKSLYAYGYEAERKYMQLMDNKQHEMHYYFKRFKTDLKTKQFRKEVIVEEEGGKSMNGMALFTLVLKFLKSHFQTALEDNTMYFPADIGVKNFTVTYVVTVPAKWDNASRECMKAAAKKAGMTPCYIFTESEAAGRYCRLLPLRSSTDEQFYLQSTGSRHAIVNLGGSGIDTSVQEITEDGMDEFAKNVGTANGATRVDTDFLKFFNTLFGNDFCETFAKKNRTDYLELQYEFEVKKRQFSMESDMGSLLQLPASLLKMYTNKHKQSIQFMIDDTDFVGRILQQDEYMILDKTVMKDIFGPSVKSTVGYLTNLSRDPEMKRCDAILLVGGFANSPVVSGAVKFYFPNAHMVNVEDGDLAVLYGGVLLGHNPGPTVNIKTNVSYGLGMALPYNEKIHPKNKRFLAKDIEYCCDVFDAQIVEGRRYNLGEMSPVKELKVNRPRQKRLVVPVYKATDRHTQFTTEESCSLLGKLSVNLSENMDGKAKVVIRMALLGDSLVVSGTDICSSEVTQEAFPLQIKRDKS